MKHARCRKDYLLVRQVLCSKKIEACCETLQKSLIATTEASFASHHQRLGRGLGASSPPEAPRLRPRSLFGAGDGSTRQPAQHLLLIGKPGAPRSGRHPGAGNDRRAPRKRQQRPFKKHSSVIAAEAAKNSTPRALAMRWFCMLGVVCWPLTTGCWMLATAYWLFAVPAPALLAPVLAIARAQSLHTPFRRQ